MDALKRSLAAEQPARQSAPRKPAPRRNPAVVKPTPARRSGSKARKTG
jgi:hypothetical protein